MECSSGRGKNWSDEETIELISLWSDDVVQEQLEGPRNKDVYQRISAKLLEKGFQRSIAQCREKVKKLKKAYRKVVDNNNFTGRKRKSCKFFDELDAILGVKPATKPSLDISSETGLPSDLSDDEDTAFSPMPTSSNISSGGQSGDNDPVVEDDNSSGPPSSSSASVSGSSGERKKLNDQKASKLPSKRKKPATKLEKSLETVIGKFMEGQKEMESRYMELEEKRMKMEMDLEKQRMEFEEKRREADRYHEMNLWSMIMQRGFPYSPSSYPPTFPHPSQSYNTDTDHGY